MKRPYSELSSNLLPVFDSNDSRKFKSTLDGSYRLRVLKIVDISRPTEKPVDEIDEPENEDEASEIRRNKNNARMFQLHLLDTNNTKISAVETERIEMLTNLKPNYRIMIEGPVEIRAGNIMLEKRHVTDIHPPTQEELKESTSEQTRTNVSTTVQPQPSPTKQVVGTEPSKAAAVAAVTDIIDIDWDDDDDPTIIVGHETPGKPEVISLNQERTPSIRQTPTTQPAEDWDEADADDDDDCIIID